MMLSKGLVLCLDLLCCADFGFVCFLPPPLAPSPRALHGIVLYCFVMRWIALHCTAVNCTALPHCCARSCRVSRLVGFLGVSRPIISRRGTLRVTSERVLWMCHCFAWCCRPLPGTSALGCVAGHAWFVSWVRRVVLHRVSEANVFCGCIWYEARLRLSL